MPLPTNFKDLLDSTTKLSRFKLGSTISALGHQKLVLEGLKQFTPWFQQLQESHRQEFLEVVMDPTAKLFKQVGQRLLPGLTVPIPQQNAAAVQTGVIRKTSAAATRALKAAEALVAGWDAGYERVRSSDDEDEEERDSPSKRKRTEKRSASPEPARKKKNSPTSSRKRAKAFSRVRRAYRATLRVARALEDVPHAFGEELEWSIRPSACPDIARGAGTECDVVTLNDLEEAQECVAADLDKYVAFLRGSAVIRHAHLHKCPDADMDSLPDPRKEDWLDELPAGRKLKFRNEKETAGDSKGVNNDSIGRQRGVLEAATKAFNGDYYAADLEQHATGASGNLHVASGPLQGLSLALPQPVETAPPEYRKMFETHDGRVLTRPPKHYTLEEFGYRLLQFAHTIPDSYEREIHFYHMYVLDVFAKLDSYEVKCVAEYDKYLRQRIASGFILSWNPDMLHATCSRFIQARKDSGLSTTKSASKSPKDLGATGTSPKTPKSVLACFQWNAGKCSKKNCKYPHVCSSCGGDHKKQDKACSK
ncbi:hypothetical protein CYMTET_48797 [Cymbomonas tetramitiformis]|uniref:C3H1-type domain-containing protein n=1 Tax=Cymbomonas tetramitiformis TaxID=36881 RepID=A0AAE0EUS9_9CHLO|nr:hypothetical protein CYMTET_48797 [Cymbomonas tetramitiformis]